MTGYQLLLVGATQAVTLQKQECLDWPLSKFNTGYGRVTIDSKSYLAHRLSYEFIYGPLSSELEIDHLCRNKGCYNPLHLEAVTHQENAERAGIYWQRKNCKYGHLMSEDNVYTWTNGKRQCLACRRIRSRGLKPSEVC